MAVAVAPHMEIAIIILGIKADGVGVIVII